MVNNMKNNKKAWLGAALSFAIIAVISLSAFNFAAKPAESKRLTYFYRYTPTTYLQTQIKDYQNYTRSEEPCEDGDHVCGVYLSIDNPGSNPDATEFSGVENALWASENTSTSTEPGVIIMKE